MRSPVEPASSAARRGLQALARPEKPQWLAGATCKSWDPNVQDKHAQLAAAAARSLVRLATAAARRGWAGAGALRRQP